MVQPIEEDIPGVVVFPGHDMLPRQALQAAEQYLTDTWGAWAAYDWIRGATTAQAWWGGRDVGFVQQEHPQAQPVTVVNLPTPPPG